MELGGNAPFLVLADANVDDAVAGAMLGKDAKWWRSLPRRRNRFYVAKEVASEFTKQSALQWVALKMAPGYDQHGAQLGASVSVKERNKIARY